MSYARAGSSPAFGTIFDREAFCFGGAPFLCAFAALAGLTGARCFRLSTAEPGEPAKSDAFRPAFGAPRLVGVGGRQGSPSSEIAASAAPRWAVILEVETALKMRRISG